MDFTKFVELVELKEKHKCSICNKKTYVKLKHFDLYACHARCLWELWEKHNE